MHLEEVRSAWETVTIVEWRARGGTSIMGSLPRHQPLHLQALGGTPTRVNIPQSFTASCQLLPLQALEGDHIRVSTGATDVATFLLSCLSEQVSPTQSLLSPPLAWVGNRLLRVAHMQRWGQNKS